MRRISESSRYGFICVQFSNKIEMPDIENRDDIEQLLRRFYSVAMEDELIGHHFVGLDLESHVPVFTDFWDKVLFGNRVYFGNPLAVHLKLTGKNPITLEHFQRWVELFGDAVDGLFEGETATNAKLRAKMIAHSLNTRIAEGDSGFVNIAEHVP
ncbi:MAG: group III truncated hemoglobin [Acidobacteria bacterium]|nr:MAG: group III truncated hemoglobin [Acidobacteriota bacterium]REJ98860.1 MAG: group III truncated hemoglobin [Acidobacteriota bacterium]REK16420.1 MAG: group III truncated hemoglobin [Acidobacteriota bacterium]REK44101.1 MAG: group III truncated hemoglobin [Acidobacteriota bacterium]